MHKYPRTLAERQALRQEHADRILAAARLPAETYGWSTKCGRYENHAPDGCRNNGSGCLCPCHDPEDTP